MQRIAKEAIRSTRQCHISSWYYLCKTSRTIHFGMAEM